MKNRKNEPLKQEELDFLQQYLRVTTMPSEDRRYSLPALDLLDLRKLERYLDELTSTLQSPSIKVTASQFCKRYAFMMVAPSLFVMTRYGKALNVRIDNCNLESCFQDGIWIPKLRLNDFHVSPIEQEQIQRDQVIQTIFSENISKVWEALSTVTRVPMSVLWENTAVYVYWLYESFLNNAVKLCGEKECQVENDFAYLLNKAPAELFGQADNPLYKYYGPKTAGGSTGESVRMRKTCCYYYQVSSPKTYCTTCPILLKKKG
ncbi:(2Fe-2S)-binding protein [Bacillus shivajii]|uniref:IucA/IucC family C-terminal-domain containing protein n=1 Tax=Bacillus shivajii TaxID=1983719 RepID=UPI001CFAF1F2|nr:IucA/IucC family C-terminal-domain containing protein [Bacillus shivajii]UCZ53753.1 (2Fe-2S)-binding protein [Bacillus shivajii]